MEELKKLTFSFLFFIISITVLNAQAKDCSCKKDFDFLNQKIQQTPSYKVNKVVYELEYTRTKKISSI
jgi:hypothetical protein